MTIAAVYATWPLARFPASRATHNLGDPLLSSWMFGWGPRGLLKHGIHAFDAPIFWPEPLTLALSENMLGLSVPMAPLTWLTGNSLLAVNLALLLCLAAGGFGMYLLVRALTGDAPAAILAGVVFAAAPYRLGQISHPHVVGIFLTPFLLLLLLRLGEADAEPRLVRRRVVLLGLLVAWQFWSTLTGGVISLLAVGAWVLSVLVARRRAAIPLLRRGAVGVGIGVLLTLPLLLPYAEVRDLHPDYRNPTSEVLYYSAMPTSYFVPPDGGPLVHPAYARIQYHLPLGSAYWEKQLFPGLVPMAGGLAATALIAVAVARRRSLPRGVGPAASLVAVGYVLSLGPRWGGRADGIPLPFLVIESAFSGLMRVPARINLLVVIGLCIATGVMLSRLPARWRLPAFGLAVVVLLVELTPSRVPMIPVPGHDDALRAVHQRPGAVLALPTGEVMPDGTLWEHSQIREATQMWLGTAHYRPMVNGYMAYFPTSYRKLVAKLATFPTAEGLTLLADRDVRTVVVRTDMVPGSPWADVVDRLEHWPGVRLVTSSASTRVYDITAAERSPG